MMKREYSLQDYIDLIHKRKEIIIISTVAFLIVTIVYNFTRPPVYESVSTFMLESRDIGFSEEGMAITQQTRPLEYYQAVMESRTFRNRAIDALGEEEFPENRVSRRELFKIIEKGLSLNSAEYSDFIQLKARTNDAQLAFNVATVATEMLKIRCREIDMEELKNAVDFIEEQKEVSKLKLENAEKALQAFRDSTNLSLTADEGGLMSELFEYESKLTQIQTEKELAAANLSAINRRLAALRGVEDGLDSKERSPEVAQLKDEINQLEIRKQRLIDQFGNDYSGLSSVDEKIESKRKEMVKQLIEASVGESGLSDEGNPTLWENINERKIDQELNVYTLESREKYYQRLLNNLKKKHPRMMAQAMELMRLTRTKTVSEKVYDFLLEKGEEVKIQAATGTGGIRIIDPPILPREPVPVNTLRNIIFGLLLGLGFGFGFAYLREYADNSIRTQDDITSFLNLPVMGIIPDVVISNGFKTRLSFLNNGKKALRKGQKQDIQLKKLESRNLISRMKSKDPIVESYRSLRSNLQFASPDKPIQTMIITSPNPSEGKTITTANLGIVFALLGKRVTIVDTDLRKPKQHILFGIDRSPGLTNCLVENLPIEEVTYSTGIENLSLIPSGKMPPNPAEILSTQKMNEIIEKIHNMSDLVLFDSPPLVAVTDPMILASKLENILLVVKHRGTNREVAFNMVEQLKKAKVNIVGVVMNQASLTRGYGYYKYYSRYYK